MLKSLNPLALGVAFFICYILPITIAWLCVIAILNLVPSPEFSIGWVGFFSLVALLFCPFIAGYFVASLAKQVPLLHGLAISLIASVMYAAVFVVIGHLNAWFVVSMLFLILSGLSGAWLWRYRTGRVYEL
jgi:hypothetical protein